MADDRKKIFDRPQEEEDEGWLVSYADMVTLLLGFFIILYSFSTVNPEKFKKITDGISDALGETEERTKKKEEVDEDVFSDKDRQLRALSMMVNMVSQGSVTDVVQKIEKAGERKEVAEAMRNLLEGEADDSDKNKLDIVLPGNTLFTPGSAVLDERARQKLAVVADKILKMEELLEVEISGHTDSGVLNRAKVRYPDNWALSAARAGSVAGALVSYGVPATILKPFGYADSKPLFPERSPSGALIEENQRRNRRVHITLKARRPGD